VNVIRRFDIVELGSSSQVITILIYPQQINFALRRCLWQLLGITKEEWFEVVVVICNMKVGMMLMPSEGQLTISIYIYNYCDIPFTTNYF
jgi:hypothetical protein